MSNPGDGTSASPHNIQDLFLNGARREKLVVTIQLMDGSAFDATIKSFDRFAVVVEHDGADYLIFKHGIALIRPAQARHTAHAGA
jgi:host factor-I protein